MGDYKRTIQQDCGVIEHGQRSGGQWDEAQFHVEQKGNKPKAGRVPRETIPALGLDGCGFRLGLHEKS